MVMCVQNEERFLLENLLYHHALGVQKAYVFLDNSRDRSRAIAASLPWVQVIDVPGEVRENSRYISDLQSWCADQSLALARREGLEWILHIDPDEFAFAQNDLDYGGAADHVDAPEILRRGNLPTLLSDTPDDIPMVSLQTVELVPVQLQEHAPFYAHRYFLRGEPFPRCICDPLTGEVVEWKGVFAHDSGKSMVRTSAPVQCKNAHKWTTDQGIRFPERPKNRSLPSVTRGIHYHYFVVSRAHWRQKYSQLAWNPTHWNGGKPVEFPKLCWIRASQKLNEREIAAYLDEWLFLPQHRVRELVEQRLAVEDDTVANVLRAAGHLEAGTNVAEVRGDSWVSAEGRWPQ